MKKVIFLDRDGVINKEIGNYVYNLNDFEFTSNLFENLKKLQNAGFEFIIITNQGGIAKKLYSHHEVNYLFDYIKKAFNKHGIALLDAYYCPHHHTIEKCLCRKPLSLMLEKAVAKHNINKKQSYMIGDSERDMEAARGAGVKGILIKANGGISNATQQIINETTG